MGTNNKVNQSFFGHRTVTAIVLCLFGLCLFSYAAKTTKKKTQAKDDRVYLIHSDELYYDVFGKNPDAQIVKGHVRFLHNGGYLNCDSAYFYQQRNSVTAMGHVHYTQSDTLSLDCERGYYDGQVQMMEARKNVVLKHRRQTLTTDSLNYDRIWKNAYFYDGGKLVDGKDKLVSDWGTYNTGTKQAVFYYNVVMLNDKQRVETDTLYYDTKNSRSHVVGPSVVHQGSSIVHTDDGYFSSKSNRSELFGRSTVEDGPKTITADSLYYNKETGQAEGYGNAIYVDTDKKNELYGDVLNYNEKTGYGYATKRAMVKDYSQGPDTLYIHSDSIKLYTYNIETDSVYRMVHCFNKVRAYRNDFQAICDSMVGDTRDSCMVMYKDPIVWNGGRQVLGEIIRTYANDSTIRDAHVIGQALSIEKCDDEDHWNQISSNVLDSYFTDGALRKVVATGNVKTIYYPIDEEDSSLMLLNYTETDTLRAYLSEDKQMEKIWTSKHTSDMYPMTQIPPDKYKLSAFAWFEELRPQNKDDIWEWRGKSSDAVLKEVNRDAAPLQKLSKSGKPKQASGGDTQVSTGEVSPTVDTQSTVDNAAEKNPAVENTTPTEETNPTNE